LRKTITGTRNIAGLDVLSFERVEFTPVEYDLFRMPLWIDHGLEALRELVALQEEIRIIEATAGLLKQELRITTQRVNLFEKIKIPETEEAIRLIKIYIGDQMANAVGRCKIAKRKIEAYTLMELYA
jgi:V/A-type H+-transporting ATPase subunit D